MGGRCYVLLRDRHNVPITRRGDVPLRQLGEVPPRLRWVFHLQRIAMSLERIERRSYDVATTSCCRVCVN